MFLINSNRTTNQRRSSLFKDEQGHQSSHKKNKKHRKNKSKSIDDESNQILLERKQSKSKVEKKGEVLSTNLLGSSLEDLTSASISAKSTIYSNVPAPDCNKTINYNRDKKEENNLNLDNVPKNNANRAAFENLEELTKVNEGGGERRSHKHKKHHHKKHKISKENNDKVEDEGRDRTDEGADGDKTKKRHHKKHHKSHKSSIRESANIHENISRTCNQEQLF